MVNFMSTFNRKRWLLSKLSEKQKKNVLFVQFNQSAVVLLSSLSWPLRSAYPGIYPAPALPNAAP